MLDQESWLSGKGVITMVTQVKPSLGSPASGKPMPLSSASSKALVLAPWRARGIAFLRILFGVVWGIDAWFKFQADFINNFSTYLTGSLDGQPGWVQGWINFWINVVKVDPHVFAHLVAFGELAIAIALILGAFSNLTAVGGILLSIVIWTTAEGFGGPYVAGSTDIGAAIIYVLVFVGLFLALAGMTFGLDRFITPKLGRFGWLASGTGRGKVQ
jgi:uncharacterized membrane protein YphA (DoxX/SURF4 family)